MNAAVLKWVETELGPVDNVRSVLGGMTSEMCLVRSGASSEADEPSLSGEDSSLAIGSSSVSSGSSASF